MQLNFTPNYGSILKMLLLPALSFTLIFSSCKKDSATSDSISEEEVAEIMVQTVDPASGGLALQTTSSVTVAITNTGSAQCGVRKDSTLAGSINTTARSFTYNFAWSRLLTCNGPSPSKMDITFGGTTTYSGPRMSSNDNASGTFVVTGLSPGIPELSFDQTYIRTGTQQSKIGKQRTFTSTVNVTTTNVKVSKATQMITSGAGVIAIAGKASTGENFSYTGAITFLGGQKALIVLSTGATFNIQW